MEKIKPQFKMEIVYFCFHVERKLPKTATSFLAAVKVAKTCHVPGFFMDVLLPQVS
jgi:hypothetical protein